MKINVLDAVCGEPFDKLRTGLMPFVVSLSNHEGSVPIPIGTKNALPQEWQRYYYGFPSTGSGRTGEKLFSEQSHGTNK